MNSWIFSKEFNLKNNNLENLRSDQKIYIQGEEDTQILEIAMGDEDDQMSISPDFVKSQNQNTKLTFTTTYEFKPEEFGYAIWDGKTGVETRYVFSV